MSKLRIIELVVFILVLGIAGIITFMSFTANSKESRDATRTADLIRISDGLKIYATSAGKYPFPDEGVEVKAGTASIIQQGYAGDGVFASITQTPIKDPLGDNNFKYLNYYTYSTNAEQKQFQLMAFLEQGEQVNYSPLAKRTPITIGDDVGILIENETNRPIQETKMGIDILQTKQKYDAYIGEHIQLHGDNTALKHFIDSTPQSRAISCKEIRDVGFSKSGYYYINPLYGTPNAQSGKTIKVFCDMESVGGGWTRLYYKDGPNTCSNGKIIYSQEDIKQLFTKDFAVSDKLETLNSEGSWILKEVDFNNLAFSMLKMTNVANCKAPNGENWSMDYGNQYIYYHTENNGTVRKGLDDLSGTIKLNGLLTTMGDWNEMFYGCDSMKKINDNIEFLIGGFEQHSGLFIHGLCNNFSDKDHSITSRWDWDNTRVIWVR